MHLLHLVLNMSWFIYLIKSETPLNHKNDKFVIISYPFIVFKVLLHSVCHMFLKTMLWNELGKYYFYFTDAETKD